jgi:hypothetical protein
MRVGYHNMQTKTNKVNKTWVLLQTTGGKDESNIKGNFSELSHDTKKHPTYIVSLKNIIYEHN